MANEMLSFFISLLSAVTAWMSTGPMLYLFGTLIALVPLRMFMSFVRPDKD